MTTGQIREKVIAAVFAAQTDILVKAALFSIRASIGSASKVSRDRKNVNEGNRK